MPPDIRGTRRDRPARHSQHLPPSPTRVSTLATTQRTKLGVETDRSIYLSLSESERNETHAPSFDRIEANRRVKRIGGVSADRLSSSGYGTKRLFRVTTMDPRRGACSECGTPTVARPPRTRALYERETGIDRTGACACPLLRLSSPPPPPPSIRFLVLLSLSLSLRALSNERACLLLVYDRDQTDWINRKSLPPPRLQVTDRHPFRERVHLGSTCPLSRFVRRTMRMMTTMVMIIVIIIITSERQQVSKRDSKILFRWIVLNGGGCGPLPDDYNYNRSRFDAPQLPRLIAI